MAELDQRTITSFQNLTFYIPSQQRGYRWTTTNIIELLEDFLEFTSPQNNTQAYCMQPLALVNRKSNEYQVLDGQQRLTTIYLLFKSLREQCPYNFVFERDNDRAKEEKRVTFLENEIREIDSSSIDRFHISRAYLIFEY